MRWVVAVALLVGCGGASGEGAGEPGRAGPSRGEICLDLAAHLCEPGLGCRWRHIQDEYECRSRFRYECCGRTDSCGEAVEVNRAQLLECKREAELNRDCNRIYTPACFALLPDPGTSG